MAGEDVLKDRTPEENYDGPNQAGSIETDADEPDPDPEKLNLYDRVIVVDWSDHLDDDVIPGDKTVEVLADQDFVTLNVEDEAAVAIKIIAALSDEGLDDVMSKFFAPRLVEDAVSFIEDQTA